jgi:DNA (cytosine-5)-methyltransferase 1
MERRNVLRFLDLFAGIGGFRLGMEAAGHECVGYVEIDKFARKSYEAIHHSEGEWLAHDITKVTDEEWRGLRGTVDIICGGFPCQAFSVAGKRRGFQDTRGTLFFDIARAAEQIQPQLLFLENVKGLLSHNKGETFAVILSTLDELGYDAEWQVLNSKDFGVPQNRERVFIIGHLRDRGRRKVFPISRANQTTDISVKVMAHRNGYRRNTQVFSPDGITEALDTGQGGGRGHYTAIPVLTPNRAEKRQNGRRFKEEGEPMFTLTAQDQHGVMIREDTGCQQGVLTNEYRIRKLTPRECWRLQGFSDSAFDKAQKVNSDSQLYKQAGNSVTVNVVFEIAKRLG